jgi:hypothetical protein
LAVAAVMGSVAAGSLAVAAVHYFGWLLADATILKLYQPFFCGLPYDAVLQTVQQ